jgi:hypothetical protein
MHACNKGTGKGGKLDVVNVEAVVADRLERQDPPREEEKRTAPTKPCIRLGWIGSVASFLACGGMEPLVPWSIHTCSRF